MTNEKNFDMLADLFAQIERAWLDRRDRRVVHDLGEEYPEFREELWEFFEDLVFAQAEPSEEIAKADERISQWLSSSGLEIATAAAAVTRATPETTRTLSPAEDSSSKSDALDAVDGSKTILPAQIEHANWVFFLRKRTKQTLSRLAKELTNVTIEYLVLVSRHPNVVPSEVKSRIAEEVEKAWGIPVQESFEYLSDNPELLRAASRSEAFDKNPKTFHELLDRAAFTGEQKDFWLRHSKSSE